MGLTRFRQEQGDLVACPPKQVVKVLVKLNANNTDYTPAYAKIA